MTFNHKNLKKDIINKRIFKSYMSLRDAAKEIGISASTLCRIEQSKHVPDVNTLALLCTWLDTYPNRYFYILKKG